jgi:adenosylmethionine-8-amino-7-oxononanoate aminotransferase
VLTAARERGVLVYMGTGNADGVEGDTILLGPPFVITDDELQRVAEVIAEAVDVATASEAAAR